MKGRNFCIVSFLFSVLFVIVSACGTTSDTLTNPSTFAKTIRKASKDKRPMLMFSGVDTFSVAHIMIENKRRDMTVQL
jgi:hypothetical protein